MVQKVKLLVKELFLGDVQHFLTDLDKKEIKDLPNDVLSLNVLSQTLKNNGPF